MTGRSCGGRFLLHAEAAKAQRKFFQTKSDWDFSCRTAHEGHKSRIPGEPKPMISKFEFMVGYNNSIELTDRGEGFYHGTKQF